MAIIPATLDYTDRDKQQILSRLAVLIPQVFPEWTDLQIANFGNLLVEMFAFVMDVLGFYQDNQAGETRITTAQLRQNLVVLARLVGYRARGATASQVEQTISISAPAAGTVTFPRGTIVQTAEITSPIQYQIQDDVELAPGETSLTVLAENSVRREYAVQSTGLPDQRYTLPFAGYLEGSLEVGAANGTFVIAPTEPQPGTSLLGSSSSDRHYMLQLDRDDRPIVTFGNGVNGVIPTGLIQFPHKTGGGATGRVEAARLTKIPGPWSDSLGNVVQVTTANAEASTPGTDRESAGLIRLNAPAVITLQRRSVSRPDYEVAARQVPGIVRALHLTKNELPSLDENTGILWVVPSGGGEASQLLLDAVAAQFAEDGPYPATLTYSLDVRTAPYLLIDIEARVWFASSVRTSAQKSAVKVAALAGLETYFQIEEEDATPNERVNFGYYYFPDADPDSRAVSWSDIHNVVRDTAGVGKVDAGPTGFTLNGVRGDLPIDLFRFPVLNSFTMIDASNGAIIA